jgi:ABC-type methionine transport system permease subunit
MMATPTAALVATIPCAIATVVVACLINPPNGVKCGERERERERERLLLMWVVAMRISFTKSVPHSFIVGS